MLNEKKKAYDDYETQLAQAKREAAVYKANIKKQSDEIRQLESASSQKDSEIQAAKRAEEEARKAQEEALQSHKSKKLWDIPVDQPTKPLRTHFILLYIDQAQIIFNI